MPRTKCGIIKNRFYIRKRKQAGSRYMLQASAFNNK